MHDCTTRAAGRDYQQVTPCRQVVDTMMSQQARYLRLVEQGMQGCKARPEEDITILEVLLGGGGPLRQSSGHHLGAGAVVPRLNQQLLAKTTVLVLNYHYV